MVCFGDSKAMKPLRERLTLFPELTLRDYLSHIVGGSIGALSGAILGGLFAGPAGALLLGVGGIPAGMFVFENVYTILGIFAYPFIQAFVHRSYWPLILALAMAVFSVVVCWAQIHGDGIVGVTLALGLGFSLGAFMALVIRCIANIVQSGARWLRAQFDR